MIVGRGKKIEVEERERSGEKRSERGGKKGSEEEKECE